MSKCQKILILGNGGSGKSTLSLKLSSIFKFPVLHLDAIYWIQGWKKNTIDEFERCVNEMTVSPQ